jgi:LacI family transcriptional regulator
MGARAAQGLLGLIGGADPADMSFTGETTLIIRESSGVPHRVKEPIYG